METSTLNDSRNDLRYIRRLYHPTGNFLVRQFDGSIRRFDLIFDEFKRDPSLPVKLIPTINDIVIERGIEFWSPRYNRNFGLWFTRTTKTLIPEYQDFCDAWNLSDA